MVQPNPAGKFLGAFLGELVRHGYLRLPAACGCLRAAFTTKETSLAMADVHTAHYFCLWLKAPPLLGDAGGLHTEASIQKRICAEYASCGVSLADLIPEVGSSSYMGCCANGVMLLMACLQLQPLLYSLGPLLASLAIPEMSCLASSACSWIRTVHLHVSLRQHSF